MARTNRTNRRPQRIKHRIEDKVARRALVRAAEESYRNEPERTYVAGRLTVVTFTDPSWQV